MAVSMGPHLGKGIRLVRLGHASASVPAGQDAEPIRQDDPRASSALTLLDELLDNGGSCHLNRPGRFKFTAGSYLGLRCG